jgi:ABC-type glycerol-3-phosphate transport system permease component
MTETTERRELRRKARRKARAKDTVIVITAVVLVAAIVFPFAWMVLTSLRPAAEMFGSPRILPDLATLTLDNYRNLFATSSFARYFVNSLLVSVVSMIISVVVAGLSGYAFSRYQFRLKRPLLLVVIAVHLFPFVILITPLYSMFGFAHLLNNYAGLVLAYVAITLPVATYLMIGYIDGIPRGLDEAARIDGCRTVDVLFRIVLPVAWPGVATVGIQAFIVAWEEYLFAKVLMTDDDLKTVQVGLSDFFGEFTTQWDLVLSASVVASVPTIIVIALAQRRLVTGMAVGGVKE